MGFKIRISLARILFSASILCSQRPTFDRRGWRRREDMVAIMMIVLQVLPFKI